MLAIMKEYDPFVQDLAYERLYALRRSGKQLFDSKTHKLHPSIRDEAQALRVLLLVKELARLNNIEDFWFSAEERKLLKRQKRVSL